MKLTKLLHKGAGYIIHDQVTELKWHLIQDGKTRFWQWLCKNVCLSVSTYGTFMLQFLFLLTSDKMKFNFNTAPQWGALGRSKNRSKNTVCGMRLGPGFFRMIQLGWPWLLVTLSQFHWLIFIERERVAWSAPLKRSCRAEWQKRFSYLFDVVLNIWMPCRSMSCQSHISSAPTNEPALTIRHRCRDSTFPDDAILTICTFLVFFFLGFVLFLFFFSASHTNFIHQPEGIVR